MANRRVTPPAQAGRGRTARAPVGLDLGTAQNGSGRNGAAVQRAGIRPSGQNRRAASNGDGARAASAVGYLRRSTDRQEQSIPDQQRAVEQYCAEHSLTLLRCYTDDAISGTSTVGRHAFQQMIADAQRPCGADFGVIVVYDVKRFGRVDNDEAGYYRHILREHGVEVRYASENFTGDGTDDLLRPVKQWQARQESKDLSKVTIRGLLSKSTTGHWMGGAPPYGYDLRYESQAGEFLFFLRYMPDGSKVMYDARRHKVRMLQRGESVAVSRKDHCTLVPSEPARVDVVKRIFRMYVEEGRGFKAIADQFNREKIPPARGPAWTEHYSGQWAMTTTRAILVNPAYCGDVVWNRRTDARFHRIKDGVAVERRNIRARRLEFNDRSDWTVVRDAHPGLVPRRLWEMANRMIEAKPASADQRGVDQRSGLPAGRREYRSVGGWTGPRARFLLSKLVSCARCGSRYEGYTLRRRAAGGADGEYRRTYCYACGGYIRRGKSVCDLGAVSQAALENAVIDALVVYYARYRGEHGQHTLGQEIRKHLGLESDDVGRTQQSVHRQMAKLEATTRRLLNNITPVNREVIDRRLGEIKRERSALIAQVDSLDRLALSKAEVRDMIDDTTAFIARLETTLREGPLHERQAAIRRCVQTVRYLSETARASLSIRRLPFAVGRDPLVCIDERAVAVPDLE